MMKKMLASGVIVVNTLVSARRKCFRHASAECRAESLTLRPLHQDDEHHEHGDERLNDSRKLSRMGMGTGNMTNAEVCPDGSTRSNGPWDPGAYRTGTYVHPDAILSGRAVIMSANDPL
jgi:hypothetical protein